MSPLTERSLRGRLVTIGPILPEDTGALFLWKNDVAAAKSDSTYRPLDWLAYKKWFDEIGTDSSRVVFAIRKLEEAPIIGFIALAKIHAVFRSAEMGLRIGKEADRGHGYGKDAIALVLDYAWRSLNLSRIQLNTFANNERAIRTYESAGFEYEGTLKRAAYIDGNWVDVVIMAALRPFADAGLMVPSRDSEDNIVRLAEKTRAVDRGLAN
jgi:RimJ/RimL family protein N-acetyltransferase